MNEEVIISIKGLQVTEDTNEDVEVVTPGKYYLKKEKHYLLYDEVDVEDGSKVQNVIKISPGKVEVTKKGAINTKLNFEREKTYETIYSTPFGEFLMETKTDDVLFEENDEMIQATVIYELFFDGKSVSSNNIVIQVQNKKS